jgi:hypothetical protein
MTRLGGGSLFALLAMPRLGLLAQEEMDERPDLWNTEATLATRLAT